MTIWETDQERIKREYNNTDLHKLVDEYLHNEIQLKHLRKNEMILSQEGQYLYKQTMQRQEEITKILKINGVEP